MLREGINLQAISFLDSAIQDFQRKSFRPIVPLKYQELLAVAWLRDGETENCIRFHSKESCIVPIKSDGLHKLKKGSRNAARIYSKLLDLDSLNYKAMFLMNIAHLTLGNYPDSVPKQFLIPLSKFPNDSTVLPFPNVSPNLGFNTRSHAGGTILEDFNNDGFLDIIFSGMHLDDQLQFFLSNGDGSFEDATESAGLLGITGGLNILQVDYNNDGLKDIMALQIPFNRLKSIGLLLKHASSLVQLPLIVVTKW